MRHPSWLSAIWGAYLAVSLVACGSSSANSPQHSTGENPTPSPTAEPELEYPSLEEELGAYFDRELADDEAGVAVLVMTGGEVVYQDSRGSANKTAGIAITERTGFRLASVSKSFTALAIMQLAESGQLDVANSVREYIPELSPTWQSISLERLLTHQSGIPDVLTPFSFMNGLTNDNAVSYYASHPSLSYTPGSRTSYSNTNYVLLAEVIERATGYSFADYMRMYLFDVAGMADSYIDDENQPLRSGDALNHAERPSFYGNITAHLAGNMGQVSSTRDFIGFFNALRSGEIVSADTMAVMTEPRGELFGGHYGYGFMLFTDTYGHGGLFDGFRTQMTVSPGADLALVILTNGGEATQDHLGEIRSIICRWH